MSSTGSWFWLHSERLCEAEDQERDTEGRPGLCSCPAHIGHLCGRHFSGANAAQRSLALLLNDIKEPKDS